MTAIIDEEEKASTEDNIEIEVLEKEEKILRGGGARRILEDLMDEKKLQEELDDYFEP